VFLELITPIVKTRGKKMFILKIKAHIRRFVIERLLSMAKKFKCILSVR
jgi:hypothetical protein